MNQAEAAEFHRETADYISQMLIISEKIGKAKKAIERADRLKAEAQKVAHALYTEWQYRATQNSLIKNFCAMQIQFDGNVSVAVNRLKTEISGLMRFGETPGLMGFGLMKTSSLGGLGLIGSDWRLVERGRRENSRNSPNRGKKAF